MRPQQLRKVWKGSRATRWQYWLDLTRKHDLLRMVELLLPHLTAKRVEAEVVAWFLRRSCKAKNYTATCLDRAVLESLYLVKRNGGEAPAEVAELLSEVIPNQAVVGSDAVSEGAAEGVETRSVRPNDNPIHECPAAHLQLVSR